MMQRVMCQHSQLYCKSISQTCLAGRMPAYMKHKRRKGLLVFIEMHHHPDLLAGIGDFCHKLFLGDLCHASEVRS